MILDANTDAVADLSHKRFDVCIAGAGVAGIVLATELAAKGLNVVLLEGGGDTYSEASQDLYKGKITGRDYHDLDQTRLRFLGGSSNHWAGWCRPLDANDFTRTGYGSDRAWPIRKDELDPWSAPAAQILELPSLPAANKPFQKAGSSLEEIEFSFSPPVRFGKKYWAQLQTSKSVLLVLNANLVDINLSENALHTRSFVFYSFDKPNQPATIHADSFVLALGGLENARALLNCNKIMKAGIGNAHDQVGRYFSDHPHFNVGVYFSFDKNQFGVKPRYFSASEAFIREKQISPCSLRLETLNNRYWNSTATMLTMREYQLLCTSKQLLSKAARLLTKEINEDSCGWGLLRAVWGQRPNPSSRVVLGHETDRFGWRRLELDWRLTQQDWNTPRETALEFAVAMIENKLGRVRIVPWLLEGKEPPQGEEMAGNHHMGTTRMAENSSMGVVDRDCKVFGLSNLFIAGSSVFTSPGYANPTFTIVQLALRMAEHLFTLLKSTGR